MTDEIFFRNVSETAKKLLVLVDDESFGFSCLRAEDKLLRDIRNVGFDWEEFSGGKEKIFAQGGDMEMAAASALLAGGAVLAAFADKFVREGVSEEGASIVAEHVFDCGENCLRKSTLRSTLVSEKPATKPETEQDSFTLEEALEASRIVKRNFFGVYETMYGAFEETIRPENPDTGMVEAAVKLSVCSAMILFAAGKRDAEISFEWRDEKERLWRSTVTTREEKRVLEQE